MEQGIANAFAELGLKPGSTQAEVKAAWRRLVSQWHPDRNPSAAAVAKMQRVNRAVEAIRQAGLAQPDEAAAAPPSPPSASPPAPPAPPEPPMAPEPDAARAPPLRTIHRKVKLTLEEAAFACTKVLRGKLGASCAACEGAGWRVIGGHCPICRGSGAVRTGSWFGWSGAQTTECEACHGGGIARQVCSACAGSGKAPGVPYSVTVRFPHGVRDGDELEVDGRSGKPGALAAHLSIRVEVQEHALLKLDADGTVRCEMPVDGFALIANRAVDVPTVGGLQRLDLRRDQLSYRLPGQGFPVQRRGARGDQIVSITPVFPAQLTNDQQILFDQLIATTSGPGARHTDERLRAWMRALHGNKRSDKRGHKQGDE